MVVEFARASDAGEILQIFAEGFPAGGGCSQRRAGWSDDSHQGGSPSFAPEPGTSLLPYTILGCTGSLEYVTDTIALREHGCDSRWIVARDEGIAGFFQMRLGGDELFASHMYLRDNTRGRGLGRYLWKRSLELTRQQGMNRE